MPRARTSKPKTQRVPITWTLSDEVGEVAAALFAKHETHFWGLRSFKLAYVIVGGGKAPKRDRIDGVMARFVKLAPLHKTLSGYDAAIWVREVIWQVLNVQQREALISHELSHGTTNDKGELTIQKHDLEEFAWVVRHYGAWDEGVELFGRQLSLFGTPDGDAPGERAAGQLAIDDEAAAVKADERNDFADIDAQVAARKAARANAGRNGGDQPAVHP